MGLETFVEKLKSVFRGEVADDEATLTAYSRDASLFELRPKLVVYPSDVEDLKNLVKLVGEARRQGENWSLTPRAAGSDMSGGPLTESVVVEMTRSFNQIKEIGSDYAVVEPGVYYRDFAQAAQARGLLLPSYPASKDLCTLGGMIANNAAGEKTLTYGKTADYVEELKAVLADGNEYHFQPLTAAALSEKKKLATLEGEIYRRLDALIRRNLALLQMAKPNVSKNSAGYYLWDVDDQTSGTFDLTKVLVGSQGTLGIITQARLRLIRPKAHSRLLLIFLPDLQRLAEVVQRVLTFQPESFESYDDHTLRIAVKVFPQLAKRLGGNLLSVAREFLPEFWWVMSGGIPKLILLAEFTAETPQGAVAQARAAEKSLADLRLKTKVTPTAAAAEKYWLIRRESFNLLRRHVRGRRTAPFIDDLIVRPEKLPEFLPQLYELLDRYEDSLTYTIAGHVGDGNFHIIPLMDLRRPESKTIIRELANKVYELVLQFGGSLTAEHNDGLIRSPFLKAMFGEQVYRLFEETKRIFDPQNIFNPGKKVGATFEYALSHLVES